MNPAWRERSRRKMLATHVRYMFYRALGFDQAQIESKRRRGRRSQGDITGRQRRRWVGWELVSIEYRDEYLGGFTQDERDDETDRQRLAGRL